MNIITALKKQVEKGNTMILVNGAIVSEDKVRGALLESYLYKLKTGVISPDMPFTEYYQMEKKNCLTVNDLICHIAGEEIAQEVETVAEEPEAEEEPEPVEETPEEEKAEETPKKAPRRRTTKK